jgi:hypothetical protein
MAIVPPPVLAEIRGAERSVHRQCSQLWVRAALVVIAVALIGIFAIAAWLDPYRDGKVWLAETHRQLGLPSCTFKDLTGYPCPSCGMTSSFALAIRGDLWHSVQANFVGTLLALGGLAFIPWAVASAFAGRLLGIRNAENVLVKGLIGFLLLMFGRWAVVLALAYWSP